MPRKALKIAVFILGALLALPVIGIFWTYIHQDKIIQKAIEATESRLNGKLEVGGFAFTPFGKTPGLTFALSDIRITDSLYHTHQKPFCEIKRVDVTFGLETLLTFRVVIKNILIQDGSVFLFVRRDSYSNKSIFASGNQLSPKKLSGNNPFGKIKKLKFHNLSFTYADSLQEKYFGGFLKRVYGDYHLTGPGWNATLDGPIEVDQLVFNSQKGAFLKNRPIHLHAGLQFDKKGKNLRLLPETYIQLVTQERISISGSISTAGKAGPLSLDFRTNSIRVPLAASLLADSIAHKIDKIGIDTYVSADVALKGKMGDKNPAVDVTFKTDTFSYKTQIGIFREVRTTGRFTNRIDTTLLPSNANSEIKSGRITGYFEEVPVKGFLQLTDLSDPTAKIVFHAKIDSTGLNSLLDTTRYYASHGHINLDLWFNGKLNNLYNPESDQIRGRLGGKASVRDLAVSYRPRKVRLSRIDCDLAVSEQNLIIHKLDMFDNLNVLHINGNFKRYLHLLLGSPQPAQAKININIPKWKLNWIEVLVAEQNQTTSAPNKFSKLIDQLLNNTEVDASLKAGELTYHNLKADKVTGTFRMTPNATIINSLTLNAFGGSVSVKGELESPGSSTSYARLKAAGSVRRANVKSVLYSFNDFGQKALSSRNVNGLLNLNFELSTLINPNVSLVPHSMKGFLDIDFREGQLINFEPFLKIKKIIFKKRPLENVRIAPIKKRFELNGQEVKVEKFQIETNVITLFVEGQYSFGDKTDLTVQFPLKNLRKRDEDYEFQTYDSSGMPSIFLRAVQEEDGVNIKLDSRRKARKRKRESQEPSETPGQK